MWTRGLAINHAHQDIHIPNWSDWVWHPVPAPAKEDPGRQYQWIKLVGPCYPWGKIWIVFSAITFGLLTTVVNEWNNGRKVCLSACLFLFESQINKLHLSGRNFKVESKRIKWKYIVYVMQIQKNNKWRASWKPFQRCVLVSEDVENNCGLRIQVFHFLIMSWS